MRRSAAKLNVLDRASAIVVRIVLCFYSINIVTATPLSLILDNLFFNNMAKSCKNREATTDLPFGYLRFHIV
jgi:hypothetical protein